MNNSMDINVNINLTELPACPKCKESVLLPFPDETREGNVIFVKSWMCPSCHKGLTIRSGTIYSESAVPPNTRV